MNPAPSERKPTPDSVIVSGVGPMGSRHSNTYVHRLRDSIGSSTPRDSQISGAPQAPAALTTVPHATSPPRSSATPVTRAPSRRTETTSS